MMEETWVVIVRSIIAFFSLVIYTRLLGKQQMGSLSYFDYINGITIGSLAGTLATDLSSKGWLHFIGLTVFVIITFLFQIWTLKSRFFSKVIDSEPTVVIQHGKILEQNLKKMRIRFDEIMMLLREKDTFDITKVEYAILEPNGGLSVLLKSEDQPLTPKDLNRNVRPARMMTDVVHEGKILTDNLQRRNKTTKWLHHELKKQGVENIKQVSFAAILPDDTLYVDLYKDNLSDETDNRE
ncbi:DUF421 domain-containing protein [Paenibacillus thiaminolyticus]|uniref:DUF421 domain-containing protein n=1 Tax=Paenibacillus thiaminolyticus TaxID=49283 RepID=UPI00197D10F8|nr:DUF421 domain-containing protein [Paenibacillus thiaminolyticus]WCR26827.1 DUF421 domain-containing protein [Paenibacillus thiaminolyticus]